MDVKHCEGCRDDFYNGNNPYGVKECWHLKTATLAPRLLIHFDRMPPYREKPQMRPTCYHAERHATVKPDSLDAQGYWKG